MAWPRSAACVAAFKYVLRSDASELGALDQAVEQGCDLGAALRA